MKTLAFGEILWDVFPDKQVIGGAPFNFAAHFVKNGGEAYLLSSVGKDSLADKTLNEIKNKGVNARFVGVNNKSTGKCLVTLDENSVPSYNLLDDVAYDYIDTSEALKEYFDVLYFGTLSLRSEENFEQIKRLVASGNFSEVFVDLNIRQPFSRVEAVKFGVENATILKISDEELPFVTKSVFGEEMGIEESAKAIAKLNFKLKILIITQGAKGSFALNCVNNKKYSVGGKKVECVSTVGAGDSFSAAFMSSYIKTKDMKESLDIATKVSAFVVTKTEAIPDYNPENLLV